MKKIALALSLVAAGMLAQEAAAQQSPWMVRARITSINPANTSDPIGGVGAKDRVTVSNKIIPEFDVSYYVNPNFSAELVLTYPQRHDVFVDGGKVGTFRHLPPTLTGKYHFTPDSAFNPYLGLGINYTKISSVDLAAIKGDLESDSIGVAFQAGIDFKIDNNWSFNLDAKKVRIRSDVNSLGKKISYVKIDPMLYSMGIGYRF